MRSTRNCESIPEDFLSFVLNLLISDPLIFVRSTRNCESIPEDFRLLVLNFWALPSFFPSTRTCDLSVALVAVD